MKLAHVDKILSVPIFVTASSLTLIFLRLIEFWVVALKVIL